MPNEQWRDELQEYALLVEAVSSGDRSKVVKLFGDYILRKKAAEAVAEVEAEIEAEAEAAAEKEYGGEDYDEDELDPDEGYAEDYTAEDYETYHDGDPTDTQEQGQAKRVRFAVDEEEGEENEEYYDEEGNPLYGDQEYGGEEDEFFEEEYNPEQYDGGADAMPYMSGALPSAPNENSQYYQEAYDHELGYDDGSGAYDQGYQPETNATSYGADYQEQYKDFYGSSAAANSYEEEGYHESTQNDGLYDYDVNQHDGGEWTEAFNENEQVTDDEVQDNGTNSDDYELGGQYSEDPTIPQSDELSNLMENLQRRATVHDHNGTGTEEGQDLFEESHFHGYGVDDDEDDLGTGSSTLRQAPYPDDEESNYGDQGDDDFDLWDGNLAGGINIQAYAEEMDQLQQQHWDEEVDIAAHSQGGSIVPYDEDYEEYYDEENYDEDDPRQEAEQGRFRDNPVRPFYDDVVPFPGFHRTISNERVLPYAITPGDRYDTSIRRDSMEEVNPQYNVFDAGTRFYDHYSDSRADSKADARRSNQRWNLHPMSLVDKFRERLYAG